MDMRLFSGMTARRDAARDAAFTWDAARDARAANARFGFAKPEDILKWKAARGAE
jgi:hypothetical protein